MSAKQRTRAYRLEQKKRHQDKMRKPAGPKPSKRDAYQQNKRNAERASLRQGDWGWL